LKKYRPLPARGGPGAPPLGPGGYYTGPTAVAPAADSDPGLLRSAASAVKTLEMSPGSGFKTVPSNVHQERIEICAGCPHHTGVRCQLCGQFTIAKAWLPYETCPTGKWNR